MNSPISRPDQIYPSDLSRKQFEVIRPLLESARKKTSPHKVDRLHIFNAVLYVLREGCRWRSLPRDYPDWNLCYYCYRVWRDHIDEQIGLPLLELVLKKLVSGDRNSAGKEEQTTFLTLDAQSVKNTDPAENKGMTRARKSRESSVIWRWTHGAFLTCVSSPPRMSATKPGPGK